jgi:peptide/nickel transport system ATP-binding protein
MTTEPAVDDGPLLSVTDLTIRAGAIELVSGVSFELAQGEKLGMIGESGSGKTLTALAVMGLLPDGLSASGSIQLAGRELIDLADRDLIRLRGNSMSMIFQEPMTALNPVMRVGRQIAEPLRIHRGLSHGEARETVIELLDRVGVKQPTRRVRSFPHELSGGQRQRVMIAMALACEPSLVIADEPTTALDVTVQAQVLELLRDQVAANNTALLLITHDLPVVSMMTDRVVVMHRGAVAERGATATVFNRPTSDHAQELVDSVPPMSRGVRPVIEDTPSHPPSTTPIIAVDGVRKQYSLRRASLFDRPQPLLAVDGVSLEVHPGETFGIVGESGSGKSTLARMMIGLEWPTSGRISVDGTEVAKGADIDALHHTVQMVFQDPNGSLDPRLRVGDVVAEPLRALKIPGNHEARVAELLDAVALPASSVDRYPHEFSGGQRQRIAIARALAPRPKIILADEPVSALDMSVQMVTLDLLDQLKRDFDLTMVFISHDLSVVHQICERVAVLERGRVVEMGPATSVFAKPQEPYTKTLVESVPRLTVTGSD